MGMSREESIEVIRMALAQVEWDYPMDYAAAFDMAIKALEQEPSEDAIQAALEAFGLSESTRKYGGDHSGYDTMMMYEIQDVIEGLPSVTPRPKTGHWIRTDIDKMKCSECGVIHFIAQYPTGKIDWCPNCGAKMEEEE